MAQVMERAAMSVLEAILGVDMPWKMVIILAVGGSLACGAAIALLRLALFPEFLLTTRLRRFGLRPLPGTHVFGQTVVWSTIALGWLVVAIVGITILGVCVWYAQPRFGPSFSAAVSSYFEWWASIGVHASP